ncbi:MULTISPECIES: hypothetical protein [Bacillaceae]|uniref:hypothetical protein n=1 Tax=Bacillaceae TaxID=186817 RepID=UPI00159B8CFE|nr:MULTISPECIES: hypothetical protein [Bacillaceae]UGB32362.1 hypothetical protein LPC09_08010 [Metabacillus sp. B2-18]
MARISNPIDSEKKKNEIGADGQLHGGMMETIDQVSNAITEAIQNIGKDKDKDKR